MARRTKRGPGPSSGPAGIPAIYEGPEILSALLARAGSPHDAAEVTRRFRVAQANRQDRSDVIPALFEEEPRFASPDEARRLYGNLFSLWDRLARGISDVEVELADAPGAIGSVGDEPAAAGSGLPPRGETPGVLLPVKLVEAVWKHLDALGDRERQRLHDRFENVQPNVGAWLEAIALPENGLAAAQDLAFEAWAMFDVAFGDRVGEVSFQALRATHPEPPPLESTQPALASYVQEVLDLVAEEDASFGAAPRAEVERVVATVASGLTEALAAEEDA